MGNKPDYLYIVYLSPSTNKQKKYEALFIDNKGGGPQWRKVKFGAAGYRDFILSKGDKKLKRAYIARHIQKEDWSISGIGTAGFWARWILWNKPTLAESIADTEKKFGIIIIYSDKSPIA